jgi:hypothetical protein
MSMTKEERDKMFNDYTDTWLDTQIRRAIVQEDLGRIDPKRPIKKDPKMLERAMYRDAGLAKRVNDLLLGHRDQFMVSGPDTPKPYFSYDKRDNFLRNLSDKEWNRMLVPPERFGIHHDPTEVRDRGTS